MLKGYICLGYFSELFFTVTFLGNAWLQLCLVKVIIQSLKPAVDIYACIKDKN